MNQLDECLVEQVTAGVDWLTMTLPASSEQEGTWYLRCINHLCNMQEEGYVLKDRVMQGYYGYSCGNCFVGERHDGIMVQFTGAHAHGSFIALYRNDCHVSRLDLQVTVKYEVMPQHIAKEAYSAAAAANRKLPETRRRKLYIIVGSDGGDTLYLGSPASKQRGRLYNKEVQSEEPAFARTWRYECMFRDRIATAYAPHIHAGRGAVEERILDNVVSWWQSRGVDCSHIESGRNVVIPIYRTIPTEIEAKLTWLRKQVRPTIKLLIGRGMADEMMEALGITVYSGETAPEGGCKT